VRKLDRQIVFIASFAGIFLFSLIGYVGVISNGFIERYSKEDALILRNFIGAPEYVSERFDKLKLSNFSQIDDSGKIKILVIGDSYGKDLINAVYEAQLPNRVVFSTYQINSECGNLYLDEDFTDHIDLAKLPRCRVLGWYDNKELVALIKQADQIWLASSWSIWVAERLPKSIEKLKKDYGKNVLVFGTKNFGEINLKTLYRIPVEERSGYLGVVKSSSYEVQKYMRSSLPPEQLVDVSGLFCGEELQYARCRLFNDLGEPLSFDGGHLTKAGAQFLGRKLLAMPSLVEFLK